MHGAHDIVIRVEYNGIRKIEGGKELLIWSLDQMKRDIEEHLDTQVFDE